MPALNSARFARPSAVKVSQDSLVSVSSAPEEQFPLVLRSGQAGAVNLADWARTSRPLIEERLARHGALLFRDFGVDTVCGFEQFLGAVAPGLIEYGERSSPRTRIGNGVYTSTDHPPDQSILLHNEQSYTLDWPMKIIFYCELPALRLGGTPVADSRKILARLSPAAVERFREKQVMYVRNYGDGLGLPWQEVFQTGSRAEVEDRCRRTSIEYEWKEGDRLRTRQVRPALRNHPRTGEAVWFNHALFFHFSSLDERARRSILSVVDESDVPFNTFYGDGSPIEAEVLEELREAYRRETVCSPWHQGDILLLDNMLSAHGREPFIGQRKIVVAMAEPYAQAAR
jgi:alpha-ketoglutarate-dependent taurine dioxygenase